VVVCAGLHADRLASAAGCSALPRIVPFRGDYLVLNPDKRYLVKGNIYPVPDARYPFLGVHFTPRPDGAMWLGPNAVLAFSREGYAMGDVSLRDLWEALTFEGFRRLAWSNLAFGVDEMWRALYLPAQVARLKRYIPELEVGDVTRGPSGVRAQALDEQGNLVEDFTFSRAPEGAGDGCATQLHCRNAPSPAATSSLPIGEAIADEAERAFGLPRMPAAPIDAPRRTSGKVGAQRGWWWQRRQQRDR
jgi:2-hydroxyglutarate dehydrogenase